MKTTKKLKLVTLFLFVLTALFILKAEGSFAAAKTWTGSGGDANLATAGNWQGGVAPVSGDSLVFGSHSETLTLNNNLSSSVVINGISTQRSILIEGSALKISGELGGSGNGYIDFDVNTELADDLTITLSTITFEGNISGSGDISHIYSGQYNGELRLNGSANTFTGSITTSGVSVCALAAAGSLGSTDSGTTITDGNLTFQKTENSVTINEPISLTDAYFGSYQGFCGTGGGNPSKLSSVVTLSGAMTIGSNVKFSSQGDMVLSGEVSGSTVSVLSGSLGSLTVNGQTYDPPQEVVTIDTDQKCSDLNSDATIGRNTKYIVSVDCSNTGFYIAGILAGTGKVGNISLEEGSIIAPGNSPGTISTGNLLFEEGSMYDFEIGGNDAGQYDQINVTGTVSLGNGTLRVSLLDDFKPTAGKSFVIINNDGNDTVSGAFAGLEQGATVEVDGVGYFTISYNGGDGNDVVLTAIPGVSDTGSKQPSKFGLVFVAVGAGLVALVLKAKMTLASRRR